LAALALDTLSTHPVAGELDLVLVDDAYMRHLNAAYRGKDRTTDVLSFDLRSEDGDLRAIRQEVAGEIYISLPQAQTQACQQQVPLLAELGRLLVHGLLHLAGFDHDAPAMLRIMVRETDRLLERAGLLDDAPNP
jgi:probable rRNA maturation factor